MSLDIEKEVAALQRLATGQLCERYAKLYGEPTRTRNRTHLIRKIAWKMQVLVEGDISERARRRAEELANGAELRVMPPNSDVAPPPAVTVRRELILNDPRLPSPGTSITREYKGRKLEVLVRSDGFEFDGERFKKLSAVAKKITGSHINGFRFFGLEAKR